MLNVNETVARYLASWNETDATIGAVQAQFPGYRFSWSAGGSPEAPLSSQEPASPCRHPTAASSRSRDLLTPHQRLADKR